VFVRQFHEELYWQEQQLVPELPKMAGKATESQLKEGPERHLVESRANVKRLEQV
jgi:ferritin-like metal-binding protein YciE